METANLKRKKKYGKLRAVFLLSVYVLMGLHIAHWLIAGQTLAPLELNEVLYTLHLGVITAGFIFMGVTMIGTIFFGRFFCSWACHILALQDLSEWILSKIRIKPIHVRSRIFVLIPVIAMLYLFVWPQVSRLIAGQEFPGFHVETDAGGWASFVTRDFWRNLPNIPITLFTFFCCGFLIIYLLGTRSFCQAVCPYGVLFAFADKFAPGKIKLTGSCNQCGICTSHCSSHILVHKEIDQFGKVVSSNCLKDLDCVAVCPNDAISYGFTKPSLLDSFKRLNGTKNHYHFSLKEDVTMAAFTLIYVIIFRGLYDMVPFLLAITLALLFAYFTILFLRLFSSSFVMFGKFILKRNDQLTGAGKMYFTSLVLLILFTIHSAYVHYHQFMGDQLYHRAIIAGNEQSIAGNAGKLDPILESAMNHLEKSAKWGLFSPLSQNRQLASIYLTGNDHGKAEKYLTRMLEQSPNDLEARVRLAKLMFVSGREDACVVELRRIIEMRYETTAVSENQALREAYLTLGHIEEKNGFFSSALSSYENALKFGSNHPETLLALGMIYTKAGRYKEAEMHLVACDKVMTGSPLIHNALGMIYIKTGDNSKAIFHLSELIKLQPDNYTALYNLGMLLYKSGKNQEAIVLLSKVLELNPGHINGHLGISNAFKVAGNEKASLEHRDLALELKKKKNE